MVPGPKPPTGEAMIARRPLARLPVAEFLDVACSGIFGAAQEKGAKIAPGAFVSSRELYAWISIESAL